MKIIQEYDRNIQKITTELQKEQEISDDLQKRLNEKNIIGELQLSTYTPDLNGSPMPLHLS